MVLLLSLLRPLSQSGVFALYRTAKVSPVHAHMHVYVLLPVTSLYASISMAIRAALGYIPDDSGTIAIQTTEPHWQFLLYICNLTADRALVSLCFNKISMVDTIIPVTTACDTTILRR
jgi:hypothetical protein